MNQQGHGLRLLNRMYGYYEQGMYGKNSTVKYPKDYWYTI